MAFHNCNGQTLVASLQKRQTWVLHAFGPCSSQSAQGMSLLSDQPPGKAVFPGTMALFLFHYQQHEAFL